jgi:tetratricopeptide (TPR) repeat protein
MKENNDLPLIAIIILASTLYLIYLVTRIVSLEELSKSLSNLVYILIYLVIILLIATFLYWISKKEDIIILPFEIGNGMEKYNGKAVSDLLTAELLDIQRIHVTKIKGLAELKSENFADIPLTSINENPTYNISELGTISAGPISVSIGHLLIFIKGQFPGSGHDSVITGSLQKYGEKIMLVARMEHQKNPAWVVHENVCEKQKKIDEEQIPNLIKDLAFNIVRDICPEENIEAKTWLGLKYYTEALNAFHQYKMTEELDKLEKAKHQCLESIKTEPNYEKPITLIYMIGFSYPDKYVFKAEKLLQKVADCKKDLMSYGMLWIFYRFRKYDQHAERVYTNIAKIVPKDAKDWNMKGYIQLLLSDNKKALEFFETAIMLDPKFPIAWNNKGFALRALRNDDKALQAYEMAIELDPKYARAWNNKGFTLDCLGKRKKALQAFDRAIQLDPEFSMAWYNKGHTLSSLGEHKEAIQAYNEAIQLDPNSAEIWNNKGFALDNLEKYEDAIRAYDRAIQLDPKYAIAWNNKGTAFGDSGKYDKALESFDMALHIDPQFANAWNNKGKVLGLLGKYDDAIECYDKAIKIKPGYVAAMENKLHAIEESKAKILKGLQ